MSVLIDRQALLDECLNHYEVGNIEQNCTMDWICKTVRNFPAASPWHRVEEELPDPGQDVLVYTYFYGRSIYAVAWLDNEGKWSFGTVTNWMPIEPPMETERSKT